MGPVQTVTRALVGSLGELSALRRVVAEAAICLATNLDGEEDGSKAAALSRELRLLLVALSPATAGAGHAPRPDPIARIQDDLARKRRERPASAASA